MYGPDSSWIDYEGSRSPLVRSLYSLDYPSLSYETDRSFWRVLFLSDKVGEKHYRTRQKITPEFIRGSGVLFKGTSLKGDKS